VVMEQSLVERPLPPLPVQGLQGLSTALDPLEARAGLGLGGPVQDGLQRVARGVPGGRFGRLLRLNAVLGCE
jgi:hypothetical protein